VFELQRLVTAGRHRQFSGMERTSHGSSKSGSRAGRNCSATMKTARPMHRLGKFALCAALCVLHVANAQGSSSAENVAKK
jgi:hypothetical protein